MLEDAADRIRDARRRAFEAITLAAVLGLVAAGSFRGGAALGVALTAGAAFQLAYAGITLVRRRELVAELAAEPSAYEIPEVARFGRRLVEPRQRARLADGVRGLIREATRPGTFCVRERVLAARADLEELAHELASPAVALDPACAVRLKRLLTYATESPFYNASLPPEDARAALFRVRAGLRSRD